MEPFVFRNSIDPLDKLSLEVISGEDCSDFVTFRAIVDYKTISFHIVKKIIILTKEGINTNTKPTWTDRFLPPDSNDTLLRWMAFWGPVSFPFTLHLQTSFIPIYNPPLNLATFRINPNILMFLKF